MASLVAEADTWTNTMTVPDDGDTRSAASVTAAGVGFQVAADRTRYLYNRSIAAVGGGAGLVIPLTGLQDTVAAADRFGFNGAAGGAPQCTWRQTSIASAGGLYFAVPHVYNTTITGLLARVHGDPNAVGPHVGLPATMPQLSLRSVNGSTGAVANVGTAVDASAAVGAYEAMHSISLTVAAQATGSMIQYWAKFEGEAGANSLANALHLYDVYLVVATA